MQQQEFKKNKQQQQQSLKLRGRHWGLEGRERMKFTGCRYWSFLVALQNFRVLTRYQVCPGAWVADGPEGGLPTGRSWGNRRGLGWGGKTRFSRSVGSAGVCGRRPQQRLTSRWWWEMNREMKAQRSEHPSSCYARQRGGEVSEQILDGSDDKTFWRKHSLATKWKTMMQKEKTKQNKTTGKYHFQVLIAADWKNHEGDQTVEKGVWIPGNTANSI